MVQFCQTFLYLVSETVCCIGWQRWTWLETVQNFSAFLVNSLLERKLQLFSRKLHFEENPFSDVKLLCGRNYLLCVWKLCSIEMQ